MNRWIAAAAMAGTVCWALPATAQETVPAERELKVSPEEASQVAGDNIRRIEADIASRIGQWRGVRSCADGARARDALRTALNAWIGEQVTVNSSLRVLSHGWGNANWWYQNGRRSNGSRWCRGGISSAPVFVEFY